MNGDSKQWYESGPLTLKQLHRLTGGDEVGFESRGGVDRLLWLRHETRGSTTIDSHEERRARVLYLRGYGAAMGFPSFGDYQHGDSTGSSPYPQLPLFPSHASVECGHESVLLVDGRPNMLALCAAMGIQWRREDTSRLAVWEATPSRWVKCALGGSGIDPCNLQQVLQRFRGRSNMTVYDGLALLAHGVILERHLVLGGDATESDVPILQRNTSGGPTLLRFASLEESFNQRSYNIGLTDPVER